MTKINVELPRLLSRLAHAGSGTCRSCSLQWSKAAFGASAARRQKEWYRSVPRFDLRAAFAFLGFAGAGLAEMTRPGSASDVLNICRWASSQ